MKLKLKDLLYILVMGLLFLAIYNVYIGKNNVVFDKIAEVLDHTEVRASTWINPDDVDRHGLEQAFRDGQRQAMLTGVQYQLAILRKTTNSLDREVVQVSFHILQQSMMLVCYENVQISFLSYLHFSKAQKESFLKKYYVQMEECNQ